MSDIFQQLVEGKVSVEAYVADLHRRVRKAREENDPYRCPECRCPPNCFCCDEERGCTCMEQNPVGSGPFGF